MSDLDSSPLGDDAAAAPMYVLESAKPLSESMVWRLQRTFYGDQGIEAWTRSRVPQSITTSPNIARAYARIVLGFWRDMRSSLDPSQPLYIVELGAGSGRFAYRFLNEVSALRRELDTGEQRFVYVMTDAAPSVMEFWRDNPRLRPYVDAGVLDFAHFDLLQLAPLELLNSGKTLHEGEVANPVVLIGNYIFDSIPQDAYTITDGRLYANHVTISASQPDLDLTAADSRVRISIEFEADTLPVALETETDAVTRDILQTYADRLNDTTLLLPRAALACVRFFYDLGAGRGLCLFGDFGDTREAELEGHGPPGFGAGGAFWLPVNFHALGEYARKLGGRARHPRSRHVVLNVSMLLFDSESAGFADTDLAYSDSIDHHSPDDLTVLNRALAEHLPTLKLDVMLALLRNTGWDPDYLGRAVPLLLEALPNAEQRLRDELADGIQRAWAHYYPIGETEDVPFGLGVLLFSLQRFTEALEFFERSLQDFGEDPRTTINLALTLYHLHRLPECLVWVDRTLVLDPAHELATNMRPDVARELAEAQSLEGRLGE